MIELRNGKAIEWLPLELPKTRTCQRELGYEERYEISSEGEIRNLRTGHLVKTHQRGGYYTVTLFHGRGKGRLWKINRLVALVFLGSPRFHSRKGHLRIFHKNGCSGDHRANNLIWAPASVILRNTWKIGARRRIGGFETGNQMWKRSKKYALYQQETAGLDVRQQA